LGRAVQQKTRTKGTELAKRHGTDESTKKIPTYRWQFL
jgi:hypothetical protein